MLLKSTSYEPGQPIPDDFTCDGDNVSPNFCWYDAPKETKSFVLILHDPDAPLKDGFTHWVVYNIPPTVRGFNENLSEEREPEIPEHGMQGKNSSGTIGYTGPRPPSSAHRYFARLYALKRMLDLPPDADVKQVQRAMEREIIEEAELMGTYEKKSAVRRAS